MAIKLNKKQKKLFQIISGIGFLSIGLYMILILKNVRGQFSLILGIAILLWRI